MRPTKTLGRNADPMARATTAADGRGVGAGTERLVAPVNRAGVVAVVHNLNLDNHTTNGNDTKNPAKQQRRGSRFWVERGPGEQLSAHT